MSADAATIDRVACTCPVPSARDREAQLARKALVFFKATTKKSSDRDDILPQEAGSDEDLSPFYIFATSFPEFFPDPDTGDNTGNRPFNKRDRLRFNKIGYQFYRKDQSRRVPSFKAKPGNPGYGFRQACWRNVIHDEEDRLHSETLLRRITCDAAHLNRVITAVHACREKWKTALGPSCPPGPGRPGRQKRQAADAAPREGPILKRPREIPRTGMEEPLHEPGAKSGATGETVSSSSSHIPGLLWEGVSSSSSCNLSPSLIYRLGTRPHGETRLPAPMGKAISFNCLGSADIASCSLLLPATLSNPGVSGLQTLQLPPLRLKDHYFRPDAEPIDASNLP